MPRAGLTPAVVTETGAALADEMGFTELAMGTLAERLGVKTPSLYKHVGGLGDLVHRIALQATLELTEAISDATEGLVGRDALVAAAQAMRTYLKQHPGRYAATNAVRPTGPDDPFAAAVDRHLRSVAAVLQGYGLDPEEEVHALRMIRSVLHGFVSIEVADGFQFDTNIDASFGWMIDVVDQGLRTAAARPVP